MRFHCLLWQSIFADDTRARVRISLARFVLGQNCAHQLECSCARQNACAYARQQSPGYPRYVLVRGREQTVRQGHSWRSIHGDVWLCAGLLAGMPPVAGHGCQPGAAVHALRVRPAAAWQTCQVPEVLILDICQPAALAHRCGSSAVQMRCGAAHPASKHTATERDGA